MNVILPQDLQIKTSENEDFQYCPKPLIAGSVLPLIIDDIQGKAYIKEYCLVYPPEWGKIINCAKIGKTPFEYIVEANSEFHLSIIVPKIDGNTGFLGLNIYDSKSKWNTRFKVTNSLDQYGDMLSFPSSTDIVITSPTKNLSING